MARIDAVHVRLENSPARGVLVDWYARLAEWLAVLTEQDVTLGETVPEILRLTHSPRFMTFNDEGEPVDGFAKTSIDPVVIDTSTLVGKDHWQRALDEVAAMAVERREDAIENPHCRRCLKQRLRASSPGRPSEWRIVGGYLQATAFERPR